MTTTASEVYADVVLLHKLNIFQSWTFLIKIYNILKNNILTCPCCASVESWLLWCYASRSSLLYSGFRYTMELPLQPYKIQLYTFRVQGLAIFLPWFPDYIALWFSGGGLDPLSPLWIGTCSFTQVTVTSFEGRGTN